MWTAKKITAEAASKFQLESGLLLNKFNPATPTEPADEDIVCETRGNFTIKCAPQTSNLFSDVNNAPKNAVEGERIDGWDCQLGLECLSITQDTLVMALSGAAETSGPNGEIRPRAHRLSTDFKAIHWIADMGDENQLLYITMENTASDGLNFTSTDNGKGGLALTLMAHPSIKDISKVPMAFYLLTKQEA